MQARLDQYSSRFHATGDARFTEFALGAQGDERCGGVGAVALLERRLKGPKLLCVHGHVPSRTATATNAIPPRTFWLTCTLSVLGRIAYTMSSAIRAARLSQNAPSSRYDQR